MNQFFLRNMQYSMLEVRIRKRTSLYCVVQPPNISSSSKVLYAATPASAFKKKSCDKLKEFIVFNRLLNLNVGQALVSI